MSSSDLESTVATIKTEISEHDRKLLQIISLGTVVSIDPKTRRATVQIDETAQSIPNLQIATQRAGQNGYHWWLPGIEERVIILSPQGNLSAGIIWGSLYSPSKEKEGNILENADEKSHLITYPDGTQWGYNYENQQWKLSLKNKNDAGKELSLTLDLKSGIKMVHGKTTITVTEESITLETQTVDIVAEESITLKAKTVDVK